MATIRAVINPKTGKTEITAQGYNGNLCLSKTKPFEDALGTVTEDQPTAEMYNEETNNQTENQH